MGASVLKRAHGTALALAVIVAGCAHTPEPSATGTLVGRVVDERGNGIAAARVRLGKPTTEAVTDTDGTFRFPHVPAGTYQVEVMATTLSRFQESVRIRTGRVTEVELIRGSRVSVYIEDSGGHGVYRHEVDAGMDGSHGDKPRGARNDYSAMFHSVLEPFYEAVLK